MRATSILKCGASVADSKPIFWVALCDDREARINLSGRFRFGGFIRKFVSEKQGGGNRGAARRCVTLRFSQENGDVPGPPLRSRQLPPLVGKHDKAAFKWLVSLSALHVVRS